MYRRSTRKDTTHLLNLDSLMDVLTCSVGVMVFVVIFAVLEARGANITMITPLMRDPPKNSTRVLVLCQKGKVRFLDFSPALEKMLKGAGKVAYKSLPELVKTANDRKVKDHYFRYSLEIKEWEVAFGQVRRAVVLIIKELEGKKGETSEQLAAGSSQYETTLSRYSVKDNWLAFAVDEKSIEVFREARELALNQGYAAGWDPTYFAFPYKEVVLGGGARQGIEGAPESGLGKVL